MPVSAEREGRPVNLTVQQLIEKLQEEDPQAQVIVVGRCEQCEHEVVHSADDVEKSDQDGEVLVVTEPIPC
jgi:hypothetical protein